MMPFTHWHFAKRRAAIAAIVLALALVGAARAEPSVYEPFGPEQEMAIDAVNAYLNDIKDLEGDFTQIAPDGQVSEGRFYIRRPGRARFDYTEPNRLLVIADGFWIGIVDDKLRTTDRYPIGSTPYWALLKEEVNLRVDSRILAVERDSGLVLVSIDDPTGEAAGELTLIFEEIGDSVTLPDDPPLLRGDPDAQPAAAPQPIDSDGIRLAQWLVTDAQGLTTSITVFNLLVGQRALNNLFTLHQYD